MAIKRLKLFTDIHLLR